MIFRLFLQISLVLVGVGIAQAFERPQPEISTGTQEQPSVSGKHFMAVTANPYATKAAYDILDRGGSAVDAAIAAQLVLGLVEPQSSGLGGGAFALVYDAKDKRLRSYDGRETAPNLAGSFLFFENGKPIGFKQAVIGGRAVGVPGVPMLLSDLHERHGKLTWMELFDEALELAEQGFTISPRMAKMVANHADDFQKDPASAAYFLPEGQPVQAGNTLKNPNYLETLKEFSFYKARSFYRGGISNDIVAKVQGFDQNPGLLAAYDFESYEVKERKPVCGPYRAYIVCSMGEPSSGGLTLLQILGMLEHFDISQKNAQSWHVIAQASALAFADRGIYMADPDFVNTPNIALLNPDYLKARADLINTDKPLEAIEAGTPPDWNGALYDKGLNLNQPGTTHISIVDRDRNIVSMTSSIEGAFGSHLMTNGFLLNNQLTDFSFNPFSLCHPRGEALPSVNSGDLVKATSKAGRPMDPVRASVSTETRQRDDSGCGKQFVANMVEPGKRPRSSMSPTIVFNAAGAPVLVLGSAGGSRIINHVLQRIISVVDWNMPIEEALAAPHILARSEKLELEDDELKSPLESLGNKVEIKDINSGLTAIHIKKSIITGAADPRREGLASGR